ncbi:MAG TPA: hypothetical protein VLB44_25170 [Kofleriaceae bacterium]|nr:hypothetical protein [Kofleriaceae bacterium]
MRRMTAVLVCLGGCYIDAGLGYSRGAGEAHGSMGFSFHFDGERRTSGHAAFGGTIGPFRNHGYMTAAPVDVGVSSRIVGNERNSFAALGSVIFPWVGSVGDPDGDPKTNDSVKATSLRAYLGLGYRHDFNEVSRSSGETKHGGSVMTTIGPQLMYAKTDLYGTAKNVGVSFSVTLEVDAWAVGEGFDCLMSKHDCEDD